MNFNQAYERELKRGKRVIFSSIDEPCRICGTVNELRIDVCFDCKEFVETDLIQAWDRRNPDNKWPYRWQGLPREATEEQVRHAQQVAEQLNDRHSDPDSLP